MVVYGIFIAVVLVCVVVGALQYFQIVDIADWLPMLSVIAIGALVVFYGFDFLLLRKNVERKPFTAYVVSKNVHSHYDSKHHTTEHTYYITVSRDGDRDTVKVNRWVYYEYSKNDEIDGNYVYFTSGITEIPSIDYEYNW